MSFIGINPNTRKTHEAWLLLLINQNLPPFERVKKENLIVAAIYPGPKPPKDLNSFLRPSVSEFIKLEEGVNTLKYDGTYFKLRAFVLFYTADLPGITKFLCLMGHNSYYGCRYCMIKGTYSTKHSHIYFVDNCGTNRDALPRTEEQVC